jgi:Flp pilus assembly protein TadD
MREARALIEGAEETAEREKAEQQLAQAASLRSQAIGEARKGQWKSASADFTKALEMEPGDGTWYELAAVLLENGDVVDYRRQRQAILTQCSGTTNAAVARRAMKACLLLPATGADLAAVGKLADTAMTQDSEWAESTKSLGEYRQGRFANAIEWAKKSLARPAMDRRDAQTWLVLAMAYQQLKQSEEARAALAKGEEIIKTKLPKLDSGDLGVSWVDCVISEIFLDEARALIESSPQAGGP